MADGWDFYVGGIEDGIVAALSQTLLIANGGYMKTIQTYGGELDTDTIKEAVSQLALSFPLMLVSYADGKDVRFPATPLVARDAGFPVTVTGAPQQVPQNYKHECTFSVICCSADARGEFQRRRGVAAVSPGVSTQGVYKMLADARDTLSGLQFQLVDQSDNAVLLNNDPLMPVGVEFIARLPNMTAYAIHFSTYFRYTSPDRTSAPGAVNQVVFVLQGQRGVGANNPNEPPTPGVEIEVGAAGPVPRKGNW
ncbi:MAG TPA: phage protein Gp37 [Blastocatellia bacterium]